MVTLRSFAFGWTGNRCEVQCSSLQHRSPGDQCWQQMIVSLSVFLLLRIEAFFDSIQLQKFLCFILMYFNDYSLMLKRHIFGYLFSSIGSCDRFIYVILFPTHINSFASQTTLEMYKLYNLDYTHMNGLSDRHCHILCFHMVAIYLTHLCMDICFFLSYCVL